MGASLVARARVLELQGTVVAVTLAVLQHAGSYFPDQGSNLSLLHWKADSQPLDHQESLKGPHFYRILGDSWCCGSVALKRASPSVRWTHFIATSLVIGGSFHLRLRPRIGELVVVVEFGGEYMNQPGLCEVQSVLTDGLTAEKKWFSKHQMGSVSRRRWGSWMMAQEEIISVPFKTKRKHYLGKGNRMIESPEGGGNLAQLRSREKTKRIVECWERREQKMK